jgi:hypothetical protein
MPPPELEVHVLKHLRTLLLCAAVVQIGFD